MGPQLFLYAQNQVFGPYEFAHVQVGVQRGEITPQHTLSYDGRQWFPAADIWPQLLGQAAFPTQLAAALAASPPAQARGAAQAAGAEDGEFAYYSPWPGRILAALFALVLVGCVGTLTLMLSVKLYSPEELEASKFWKVLRSATIALRSVGPPAVFFYLTFWVFRAAERLWEKGVESLSYSAGWACAWFYIPVLNLIMPALVLQNLWKSSDWTARTRRAAGTPLIPVWWASFVVCPLFWAAQEAWQRYLRFAEQQGTLSRAAEKDAWAFKLVDRLNDWVGPVHGAETVGWSVGLILFLMFDARVKTQVEME